MGDAALVKTKNFSRAGMVLKPRFFRWKRPDKIAPKTHAVRRSPIAPSQKCYTVPHTLQGINPEEL